MGTLNDWFTNEGFMAFTVANGETGGRRCHRVMYTREGLGAGGAAPGANNDTTARRWRSRAVSSSAFTPAKAGGRNTRVHPDHPEGRKC